MNEPQPGVGRLRAGLPRSRFGWRWVAALGLLAAALAGFLSGVGLSERPDVGTDGLLVKTYYALGLFVFGDRHRT